MSSTRSSSPATASELSKVSIRNLVHLPTSNLLDPELCEIGESNELQELVDRRLDDAKAWLPNSTKGIEEFRDGLINHFTLWETRLSRNPMLKLATVHEEGKQYHEGTVEHGPAQLMVSLHSVGALLDACRDDASLNYPLRNTGWTEPFEKLNKPLENDKKVMKALKRLPKSLDDWKNMVHQLKETLSAIHPEDLHIAPLRAETTQSFTDVTEQLVYLDTEQKSHRMARYFLELLSRLALVTRVFLIVSIPSLLKLI
jgi:hypothetical protein